MNAVRSWSFSVLEMYELCPAQYKYAKIDKRPTEDKPYFATGRKAHKSLEDVVRTGGHTPIDPSVWPKEHEIVYEIAALQAPLKLTEQEWGFTKSWSRTDWGSAVFRAKLDVFIDYGDFSCETVDWKTGKKRYESEDQMELYAVTMFHRFPQMQLATTRLVYGEDGGQTIRDYDRRDLDWMTVRWEERAERLFNEQDWLPRPNDKCRFCDFRYSNGGPCRYG